MINPRSIITAIATMVVASSPAFAFDLSDNPINKAAGWLNGILVGVNNSVERGLQKFDKAALMVKVEGSGDTFVMEAITGTRRQYAVSRDDVDYVFRAGLAEAATKACGGRDYGYSESSPPSVQVWNRWVAENSPFDIGNQHQRAILREPTMEFSIVWQVHCGQAGGWKYPGERAMESPIANYVSVLEPNYSGMKPLNVAGTQVTVYVPASGLIQTSYDIDVREKKGYMHFVELRLLGASVAARLKQGGANVQVVEYNDASDVGAEDGLYVTLKPYAFMLVNGGSRREWNPQLKWDQYMSVPANRYQNTFIAFGDAGATFAERAAL